MAAGSAETARRASTPRDGPPGLLAPPELTESEGGRSLPDRNPILDELPCGEHVESVEGLAAP